MRRNKIQIVAVVDGMSGKYKIGKYEFENKVAYEKALRELQFLSRLQKYYPLNQENAPVIRDILKKNGISMQSKISRDYQEKLDGYLKKVDKQEKKEKRQRKAGWLWQRNLSAVLGLLVLMLCAVGIYTFSNAYSSYKSNKKVRELQSLIVRDEIGTEALGSAQAIETASMQPDVEIPVEAQENAVLPEYSGLYALNGDLAGWLTIEGTDIDYPVMWTGQDSSYYLSHNFDKEEDKNGLLVLDYRCDVEDRQQNRLIHGHNMRSGTMFGGLKKYMEPDYYQEHKYITFDTVYEHGCYEVVAVFLSQIFDSDSEVFKYYNCLDMSEEEDYRYFIDNIDKIKLYDTDAATKFGDTFIILSTCDYSQENGRLVVVARRMEDMS